VRPGVGAFDTSADWIWHGAELRTLGEPYYSPVYLTFPFEVVIPEPAAVAVWAGLLGFGLCVWKRRKRTA